MNKMNPEAKAKWVAALRSGEYKQTQGALCDGEGYCCLGVLTDLCDPSQWTTVPNQKEKRWGPHNRVFLPSKVADWAGLPLDGSGPPVQIGNATDTLADHNDRGATFAQIADAIEKQL